MDLSGSHVGAAPAPVPVSAAGEPSGDIIKISCGLEAGEQGVVCPVTGWIACHNV